MEKGELNGCHAAVSSELPSSLPVRPLELLSSASLDLDTEDWPSLLRRHHEVLMRRLDSQDDLLHQLLGQSGSPPLTLPITVGRRPSRGTSGINSSTISEVSPKQPPKARSQQTLLTSYTVEDLQHKDDALITHGKYSRNKFSTRTDRAGEVDNVRCLSKLVRHQAFEGFFALVVISNAVFIGLDVQFQLGDATAQRSLEMQIIQYVYTFLFLMELILRVLEGGWRFFFNDDWMWSWLDLVIVISSLWEVALDIIQEIYRSQGDLESIPGISNMKSFRIIRLTRLLKTAQFVRIFRFVMALRMLVTSIISTLKALLWALVLLGLIVYVFAVLFTQAVNDHVQDSAGQMLEEDKQASDLYFGSLSLSMLTLFMSIADGVSWHQVIKPLQSMSWVWVMCYLFYISFTYFAVLNVVTGVFCQSAIESASNDHSMVVQALMDNKAQHIQKLRDLFSHLRENEKEGACVITLGLFEEKINTPAVREYFEALGLDIWDAWSFFKLLDSAGDGAVDLEEFFEGCMRFRGTARAMDVGRIMQDQRWLIKSQGRFQSYISMEMEAVRREMGGLAKTLKPAAVPHRDEQWAPNQWKA
mmetsp:Transcript_27529/g.64164  ORF Transcript_27529/g.64164 Transcript_27529/m.64164 type:complete len:587 (+) Transcript_27529:42-1802(+)